MDNTTKKIQKLGATWVGKLKKDKKLAIIVALALIAMIALVASEWTGNATPTAEETTLPADSSYQADYSYAEEMEERLTKILASMAGVGNVQVMVTLENGLEQVYAENGREKTAAGSSGGLSGDEYNMDEEHEYLVIRTDSGAEEGLIIKVIQPQIRGVAVVCEGADSSLVRQQVTEAVTAVLQISSTRVSVSRMQ